MSRRRALAALTVVLACSLGASSAEARVPEQAPAAAPVVDPPVVDPMDPFRDPRHDRPADLVERRAARERASCLADHVIHEARQMGEPPAWPVDVVHIDIDLDFDPPTGHMVQTVRATVRANQTAAGVGFLVTPLEVGEVFVEKPPATDATGKPEESVEERRTQPADVTYDPATWRLVVTLDPPIEVGEELTLSMTLSGTPDCNVIDSMLPLCGFSADLSFVTGFPFFPGPLNEPDPFTATLRITVPPDYVVAANGALVEVLDIEAETEDRAGYRTFVFDRPHPGDYVTFSASHYVRHEGTAGDVPVGVYTFSGSGGNADAILAEAADVLDFYGSAYIPYPYSALSIIQMNRGFGGGFGPMMAIYMMGGVFDISPDHRAWPNLVQLQSHELAHQWWGNLVGTDGGGAVVVSEGMAEFSSAYHYEKRKGSRSNFVSNALSYMFTVPAASDVAITSPTVYYAQYYVPIIYDKGSVVADMLRHELGEEDFLAAIADFVEHFQWGFASVHDLETSFEAFLGEDLGWFFDQWYHGTGFPRLVTNVRQEQVGPDDWRLTFLITQPSGPSFSLHLPVVWLTADREVHEERLWIEGPSTEVVFELDQPALTVAPDPNRHYLQLTEPSPREDLNLTGEVDGFDLLDLATRYGTGIVVEWNGQEHFWPDPRWELRYDLTGDGRIDAVDRDRLLAQFPHGTHPPAVDETE